MNTDTLADVLPINCPAALWQSTTPEHRARLVLRKAVEQIDSAAKLLDDLSCLDGQPYPHPATFIANGLRDQAAVVQRATAVLAPCELSE